VGQVTLRTGAWYGDRAENLVFPDDWEVNVLWPRTPQPLSDSDMVAALEHPTNQAPIRKLAVGKTRPVLVVDDLNRPTPVAAVMPIVLEQFRQAGVSASQITVVIASGMHAPPGRDAIFKKLGSEAAETCRVVIHDYDFGLVTLGQTRFGTPVTVNAQVAQSDFVLGIGGLYPNRTAGFGGGSKLVLGTLGSRSIAHLHAHHGVGWGGAPDSDLRRDLDEIASLVQMRTMITLQVDADRRIVRMHCGDHFVYYQEAVAFCRTAYSVQAPEDAEVVVSNTYPNDLSLTFARMKGMAPLYDWAHPDATRVAVAACSEGLGRHNLFPLASFPDTVWFRAVARRASVMRFGEVAKSLARKIARPARPLPAAASQRPPILLYCTGGDKSLRCSLPDIRIACSWECILQSIVREQGNKKRLKVFVYPCAPLQFLA
jgi:nickel-dependent lactate racemase